MANNPLLASRTISEMLKIAVLPEIEARLAAGTLNKDSLPLYVGSFRVMQNSGKNIVEINKEVKVTIEATAKKSITAGDMITLEDIESGKCFLKPPIINGNDVAYFLCQSEYLNFRIFFDFTPNDPKYKEWKKKRKQPYPVKDVVLTREFIKAVKPVDQFKLLAKAKWPPAPSYFPYILDYAFKNPSKLDDLEFSGIVASAYSKEEMKKKMQFWKAIDLFPGRMQYIEKSIQEYLENDFISSIHVLAPQFEGIVGDYLFSTTGRKPDGFVSRIKALRSLALSRKILIFPPEVLDIILSFVENGSFWANSSTITDQKKEINRHGILHGVFKGFESKDLALRYIVLLDGLAFVILHDKMLCGKI